ncbi:MAG: rRNA maturation RNase YbeY [bacterium]
MKFIINNLQTIPVRESYLIEIFKAINTHYRRRFKRYEVIVSLVNDAYIRKLNKQFLGRDKATDVIAFPMEEEMGSRGGKSIVLGDVVVSVQRARAQSKQFKVSLHEEIALLIVHGVLHLLGYDDLNQADACVMRGKETQVLGKMRGNRGK